MRITRQTEQELIVDGSTLWASIACAAASVPLLYIGRLAEEGWILAAGCLLFAGAIAAARTTRFVFDARKQSVRWRGQWLLRSDSGVVAFSQITDVATEVRSHGSACRLALLTPQGPVPMAFNYSGNSARTAEVRATILRFVQMGDATAGLAVK